MIGQLCALKKKKKKKIYVQCIYVYKIRYILYMIYIYKFIIKKFF